MELDAIKWLGVVCNGDVGSGVRPSDGMEVWRHHRQLIAVRHPDLMKSQTSVYKRRHKSAYLHLVAESFEQGIHSVPRFAKPANLNLGKPVLAMIVFCYLSLEIPAEFLNRSLRSLSMKTLVENRTWRP